MAQWHRRRFLRNILITVLLALVIWYAKGCPLPTQEMELHRMERKRLALESTVVWSYQGRQGSDRDMLVGVSPNYVHAYAEDYKLTLWPRDEDAATLVVLPDRTRYQDKASSYLDPAMVAVDPPPQAESARLYLDFGSEEVYIDDDKVPVTLTYTLEGERQEGVFFFQLKHQYRHLTMQEDETEEQQLLSRTEDTVLAFLDMDSPDQLSFSYILTFYDGDGDLLETVASP
mgnify:FL=1